MERRAFLAASTAAAVLPSAALAGADPAASGQAPGAGARPLVYELRRYRMHNGTMAPRLGAYVKDALVPALSRAGITPVGVWNVALGADSPTLYLLIPHPDAGSVATLDERLMGDAEYRKAAEPLASLPSGDPPYTRCDSSLHVGVATFPGIEKPSGATAGPGRLFELRTYRSHSKAASRKKIEMFEQGGELAIFRRVGLATVFFARDLVGEGLPSLTYMLAFADAATREKNWDVFRQDPEWLKLRAQPGYADAEVVSGITSTLLRPADGSQI
jgi:hypothetical protein